MRVPYSELKLAGQAKKECSRCSLALSFEAFFKIITIAALLFLYTFFGLRISVCRNEELKNDTYSIRCSDEFYNNFTLSRPESNLSKLFFQNSFTQLFGGRKKTEISRCGFLRFLFAW